MIELTEAQRIVLSHAKPLGTVDVPLGTALGLTVAVPVTCDIDYPPFDRSVMDGYAVRAADVASVPVELRVVGQIPAGSTPAESLGPGEAMQINTGAPIPSGADAVVRVESVELCADGAGVSIRESVVAGKFITPRATYVSAGQTVLQPGTKITPLEIGAAAGAGATCLTVYRRPRVAILATGDELVDVNQQPTGAQIRNSNESLLAALVRSAEGEPLALGIARDDRAVLRERITAGLEADMLCLTGGVSMGAFDFVPEVLQACGVTPHFHKLPIKPGRPTLFGTSESGTLVFGLPGNPISAVVGFELLVRPALAGLSGRPAVAPRLIRATLTG